MGELILIRHGQTEWSAEGKHTGRTDVQLTANGEAEAAALAPALARCQIRAAFASPATRARRTAELAGLSGAELDPDLQEWDYGGYDGMTTAQIRVQRPGWYLWRDGVIPGMRPTPAKPWIRSAPAPTPCWPGSGRCWPTATSRWWPTVTCCAC